jgi:hypothetical protein
MLIEYPSNILSAIIANRIQEQVLDFDLEPKGLDKQNGYMQQRGFCDRSTFRKGMNMDSVLGSFH